MSKKENPINNTSNVELSIVIPAFNEAKGIESLMERVASAVSKVTPSYEIILVNDGSTDETSSQVIQACSTNSRIRLLELARNYGHMQALATGMKCSRGKYVLTMDADLQHPPECIPEMYNKIKREKELDVLQAVRNDRKSDSILKRTTASLFYRVSAKITGVKVIPHAADFRIMSRETVQILNSLPEPNKILRFLIPELGFRVKTFGFDCDVRRTGESKYNFTKMIAFAFDSVISFSTKPLRMMSVLGFLLSGIFMLGTIVTFVIWLVAKTVPGWTSIFLLLLTSNALILASLGILGEYLAKIREATLGRPQSRWEEVG